MSEDHLWKPTVLTIQGITQELDGARSVFVGQVPGEDNVYVKFLNGGKETMVGLTFEAALALRDLLGSISSHGLMSLSTWVMVADDPHPRQDGQQCDHPIAGSEQ